MKTAQTFTSVLCISLMVLFSCSTNDDIEEFHSQCEVANYGVLTVTFASSSTSHGLLITTPPSETSRYKSVSAGMTSDTLHLSPGSHLINISSLNDDNQVIYQEERYVTIEQCGDLNISDDSTGEGEMENPLKSYMSQADVVLNTNLINSTSSELGFLFSPDVNGYITAFTVRLPDSHHNLRVTLWDFETQTVIYTDLMDVDQAHELTVKLIPQLVLEMNKKYVISVFTDDYYYKVREDGANLPYPIAAGNIKILEGRTGMPLVEGFPTVSNLLNYTGQLGFNFIPL